MSKHERWELAQMQSLPLESKIKMTEYRIREWVEYYGEDGVSVSFSGGKDSTVLLHILRKIYPNVKAVFFDTGLEYPEIRLFVKGYENVDWIRPKMNDEFTVDEFIELTINDFGGEIIEQLKGRWDKLKKGESD